MPICLKCQSFFPNRMKINGKTINLQRRKYCPACSPIGTHNTKILDNRTRNDKIIQHKCSMCGETNPKKFYGRKKTVCGKCHNQYTLKIGQEKRKWAIEQLGGCCKICGYKTYLGAIDIHHIDPTLKDEHFTCLRGWSKEKILKEIENCVPLCKNCHTEVHAGMNKL